MLDQYSYSNNIINRNIITHSSIVIAIITIITIIIIIIVLLIISIVIIAQRPAGREGGAEQPGALPTPRGGPGLRRAGAAVPIYETCSCISLSLSLSLSLSMYKICIYTYTCIHPPLIKKKQHFGGNLDGGTITPLINDDFWFDLPTS